MSDSKLKPCPFCGSEMADAGDTIYPQNRERTIWNVVCDCGAEVVAESMAGAIATWNRRSKAPDGAQAMREALAFYADEKRWDEFKSDVAAAEYDRSTGSEFGWDLGERARAALAAQDYPVPGLPPLPLVITSAECPAWNERQMRDYALAAVAADRARGGGMSDKSQAFEGGPASPMPPTDDRRPRRDWSGHDESDCEWARRNWEALPWFIANHKAIRAALAAQPAPDCPYYIGGPYSDGAYSLCEVATSRIIATTRQPKPSPAATDGSSHD